MKKLSLVRVLEGLGHPELPSKATVGHLFNTEKPRGPANFPFHSDSGEMMSEPEIDEELELEGVGYGTHSQDPRNQPWYFAHEGEEGNGKSSKTFANYKTNTSSPDDHAEDVAVRTIEVDNSHISEDVGMREKGLAYGSTPTTKQPFASGLPKDTGTPFMSDEEIARELGLSEGADSTYMSKIAHGPKADLDFFEEKGGVLRFVMNTEEEFNKNQKKIKNEKTKKRTNNGRKTR